MKEKRISGSDISYLITVILICCGIAILTWACVISYQKVEDGVSSMNNQRAIKSYLTLAVNSHDQENTIEIREAGSQLVVIEKDGEDTLETRIYLYQGNLVEEYILADYASNPEYATIIGQCNEFKVSFIKTNLLKVETDLGSIFIQVRSTQEED